MNHWDAEAELLLSLVRPAVLWRRHFGVPTTLKQEKILHRMHLKLSADRMESGKPR